MELKVYVESNDYPYEFWRFLINKMIEWFKINVDYDKMKVFENYFSIISQSDKEITAKEICEYGLRFMRVDTYSDGSIIFRFDYSAKLIGYDLYIKDIFYCINYGTLGTEPYPIFSEMFEYFAENFEAYALMFELGGI